MSFEATGRDIEWSVSSTHDGSGPVSTGTFISQSGVLTVDFNETASALYIIANSLRERKPVPGVFQVRIVTVTHVDVSTASSYAAIGRSTQFRAQVIGTNNPDQLVTWRVSSNESGTGSVSPGTSINPNGLLSVSLNETAGALYVFAESAVDPSRSGSAAITVVIPVITSLEISSSNRTVRAGSTLRFNATAIGIYEPSSNVTWRVSSNNTGTGAVTPGTSINSNGLLTVASNESLSTLFIIATSTYDNTKSASVSVTVVMPAITSVSVSTTSRSVRAGESLQFRSTVTGIHDPPTNVTWRVSSNAAGTGAVTPGTSINSRGLLTVANNESITTLYIFAISTHDPTKMGSAHVTVTIPTVTSVAVSPTNQSMTPGHSFQFYAAVRGTNNPNSAVTWRVSSNAAGTGSVAPGTNINANGLLTVSANETAAALYIFAVSVFDPTKSGSNIIHLARTAVTQPAPAPASPAVTSVIINPSTVTINRGSSQQFSASVTGTNNPSTAVTWRVSSNLAGTGSVAAGTSIGSGGLLTISANETITTLYVTATSTVNTAVSGRATVTVNIPAAPPAPAVPSVTAVTVSPSSRTMDRGSSQHFSASVTGVNNPSTTVTWRVSSNPAGTGAVASGTSISSNGLLTVSTNETAAVLYVTAVSTADTSKTGSAVVTVNIPAAPTVTSISISPSTQNITAGNSYQFNAIVRGDNNPAATVTWRVSSNPAGTGAVASGTNISSNGFLTVSANETNTTLYVIATSTVNTAISGSSIISVIIPTPTVTSISISPSTQNMTTNSSYQFSAIVRGDNNPASTVTWSVSSNAAGTGSIAPGTTISASGRLTVAPNEWNTHLYVFARSTVNNAIVGTAIITITNNNANQGSNQGSAGAP
ncbi:MAG: Ig-like domain-containing protein [Treponema sp.]|nr:Ig-like domain-containing protein [Treponema sp.]